MGGNWSSLEREPSPDPWWPDPQLPSGICTTDQAVQQKEAIETTQEVNERRQGQVNQEELEAFKKELAHKRALRHEALAVLQAELKDLRSRVGQAESTENNLQQQLEQEREEKRKLMLETEKLMEEVEQKAALEKQIQALKDVSEIGKEMLRIRELQVKELKKKLVEINISAVTAPPEDLRIEYEKQIENIRKLRTLYEERAAATLLEHRRELEREEARVSVLETRLSDLQRETDECKEAKRDLEEKIEKLEDVIQSKEDELESTKDALFSITVQNKSLSSQIQLINNLFSHMLISPNVDLDRLIRLLKENHGLITDLTEKGDSNEVAALLVDLAGQVEKEIEQAKESEENSEEKFEGTFEEKTEGTFEEKSEGSFEEKSEGSFEKKSEGTFEEKSEGTFKEKSEGSFEEKSLDAKVNQESTLNVIEKDNSQSEIASNLSKVWRVLIELLSHHKNSNHAETTGGAESCYKCVQTPSGPRSVISVSQTFLTLKDLILEKNRLVKEVSRLKTLNNHLEHRLGSQEKRLLVVTTELRKTWGVVNKLKAQHKQLHTHEKILRYELQQKRCMLNELKQELDHCRDKWELARQKNSQTEEDWKKLRKEFAARKSRKESNSAESGYEEEDVVHSPPSEPINNEDNSFDKRQNEGSEAELSEEDLENSDGNSFDTVIDLLDITCIENHGENESQIPYVLCEAPTETIELPPSLLPLSGSEFTEGLDQIESEDLAAVLDIQYQNQLLGADYNLSLPSSSGSSPIPTENDDFASSEMDVSEEDSSSNDNHVYTTPMPTTNQTVSEDKLLFGSNSSKNISKFLEGLFEEQDSNENRMEGHQNLHLDVPSTSQRDENDSTTPIVNEQCYKFPTVPPADVEVKPEISDIINKQNSPINIVDTEILGEVQQPISELELKCSENREIPSQQLFISSPQCHVSQNKTQEESLKAREERLKKLEQQCRSLVSKVTSTTFRSEVLSNKLDELHLSCSSSEEALEKIQSLKNVTPASVDNGQRQLVNESCNEPKAISNEPCLIDDQADIRLAVASTMNTENVTNNSIPSKEKTSERTLEEREARLKRLEDQCKSLFSKMASTSSQSEVILQEQSEQHNSTGLPETAALAEPTTSQLNIDKSSDIGIENSTSCKIKNGSSFMCQQTNQKKDIKPPDLDSESKEILTKCSLPGPSSEIVPVSCIDPKKDRTTEQILEARSERFKRLEEQCKSLVSKMTVTSLRSEIISNKLDELHSCYGSSENTSDKDEHSSSSRQDRIRPSPNSSPKRNRRTFCPVENEKQIEVLTSQSSGSKSGESAKERVSLPQTTNSQIEDNVTSSHSNTDRLNRTPEEILQARAQRLNRLEEQCKSLFSKMSATSQRSDVISNRLEELHEQYGQPSTSESDISSTLVTSDITNLQINPDEQSHLDVSGTSKPVTNTELLARNNDKEKE